MFKPTLFYYLIPIIVNGIFTVIFSFFGINLFGEILKMNFENILESGIVVIVTSIVQMIVTLIISVLLNYGMAACITSLKRGENITFLTFFRKIKENLGKVFSVFGRIILEGIILYLISILIVTGAGLLIQVNSMLALVAFLIWAIILIVYLLKMFELVLAEIFTNYIIYDYPDKSAKEIVKKAKEIIKKQQTKYTILILSIVWIIPFIAIEMILSNIDKIIWQPQVSTYWYFVTSITTTAPEWWFWIVNFITTVFSTLILLKVLSYTSSFYQSLCPERLFDEEYKIEKEKTRYAFFALGLIALYIIAIVALAFLWEEGYSKLYKWRYENVYVDINNNSNDLNDKYIDTKNVSIEDIIVEHVGVTEHGEFLFKVKNKSDKVAYINCINVVFKDNEGNVIEEVESDSSYFSIPPKGETYTYIYSYSKDYGIDEKYKNYDFYVELRDTTSWLFEESMILKNNEMVSHDTGNNITLEIKKRVDNLKINTVFYKENKIVGISDEIEYVTGKNSTYVIIDYALGKGWSEPLNFDKFELFVMNAVEAENEDEQANTLIYKLESKIAAVTERETVIELKNKNDQTVNISHINMVVKDKKGSVVNVTKVNESYFYIKANDEIYLSCEMIDDVEKMDIEFYYDLSSSYNTYDDVEGDFKLDFNDTEDNLEVYFTNTLDITVDTIYMSVVFFKDKKIVGYDEGTRIWEDVAPGETVTINISHPTKNWREEIEYDDFEAKIILVES